MKKVLILGKGYIGNNLYKHLENQEDIECICHSRESLDYSNLSILNKYIINNDITHVINCFGFTGKPNVDECEYRKDECWNLNVQLPLKISNLCSKRKVNYIHISSGCIYTGYEKDYTEDDTPNFGMFHESSFYSKSKHAYELLSEYGCIIRIRMPFCDELNDRSYLSKIIKYNNLIDFKNSKTYVPDLCRFISYIIKSSHYIPINGIGTINFVNPDACSTRSVVDLLKSFNIINADWKFVDIKELKLAAPRSNCVLSIEKLKKIFPNFEILSEQQAIEKALTSLQHD